MKLFLCAKNDFLVNEIAECSIVYKFSLWLKKNKREDVEGHSSSCEKVSRNLSDNVEEAKEFGHKVIDIFNELNQESGKCIFSRESNALQTSTYGLSRISAHKQVFKCLA